MDLAKDSWIHDQNIRTGSWIDSGSRSVKKTGALEKDKHLNTLIIEDPVSESSNTYRF